ncbi:hypothetical protein [Nitrobacter sp.]|uniref:hypothetical protein n=1 Tax=Nitrobacter sp. TaxID=29420 RepID=UPI003F64AE23
MPTPFELAAAMSSAAVDTVYGESFTFIAMKVGDDVDSPRIEDTTRPQFTAVGAYIGSAKAVLPHARGSIPDDNARRVVASEPYVSVDNGNMLWVVTIGDRATRLKTGETFEVSRSIFDGVKRTRIHLTARKR